MHINHGSMGHGYWAVTVNGSWVLTHDSVPMTHVTHPNLLTHLVHDPLTRYLLLLCDRLLWKRVRGVHPPRVRPGHKTPQFSHKNWGKELISTWISWKYAWFSFPCFRRTRCIFQDNVNNIRDAQTDSWTAQIHMPLSTTFTEAQKSKQCNY